MIFATFGFNSMIPRRVVSSGEIALRTEYVASAKTMVVTKGLVGGSLGTLRLLALPAAPVS